MAKSLDVPMSARHLHQASTSSLPILPRPMLPSSVKLSRTLSHSPAPTCAIQPLAPDLDRDSHKQRQHVTLLSKEHQRPQAAFGHALTSEEPQRWSRTKAQAYGHHRQHNHPLASSTMAMSPISNCSGDELPQSSALSERIPHSSGMLTGQSKRSAGSSFDVEVYAQMQLKEDEQELETEIQEELRRNLPNPHTFMERALAAFDTTLPNAAAMKPSIQKKVSTSKIPRSDSLNAIRDMAAVDYATSATTTKCSAGGDRERRNTSDSLYTHPRPAPMPPCPQSANISPHYKSNKDSLGRPISPSKTRARMRAGRLIPPLASQVEMEDDALLCGARLTEEEAMRLLQDDESILVAYGSR